MGMIKQVDKKKYKILYSGAGGAGQPTAEPGDKCIN
jgi:hypothetical protein